MRNITCGALAVLSIWSATPAVALDSVNVENAGFDKLPAKAGPNWSCAGEFEKRGILPKGKALRLGPGAELRVEVALPAAPEKKDIAADAWYAVISVDVYGASDPAESAVTLGNWEKLYSELTLTLLAEEKGQNSTRAKWRGGTPMPSAEPNENGSEFAPLSGDASERLWLRVPADELALRAESGLRIELDVRGKAAVTVDNLRVERFHASPKRSLRGKENGVNGPDLLGAGMLGFTGLTEHKSSSFSILDVLEGGPAQRAGLVRGDLVVAVDERPLPTSLITPGWEWFESSNEAVLGRAIQATLEAGSRKLSLDVLRERGVERLVLKLPLRGRLDDGFPMRGKLGERLREDLLAWTVSHQKENGGWPGTDAVNPALGGLALLGTRDRKHADAIVKCVDYLLARNPKPSEMKGLAYWTVAFQGMFFAEYYFASGDERVLEWMREASQWLPGTTHESKWGMQAFGHGPDGLPYDDKSLMAPTAHLLVYDALARKCGVESRIWEHVREYVVHSWSDPASEGHGGMGYNASYKDKGEFWSRSGLTALAAALRGENGKMRQGLCVFMQERHPWMLNSHAYGEPGAALGLLSLAVAHPPAFDEIMPQWRWRFLNSWEPGYGLRYSTPHMGAPYMGQESIVNLAYTVLCAVENGGLVMAGGEPKRWLK